MAGSQLLERNPYHTTSPPPLDEMLVYRKVTPQHFVACTHLYTWEERYNDE